MVPLTGSLSQILALHTAPCSRGLSVPSITPRPGNLRAATREQITLFFETFDRSETVFLHLGRRMAESSVSSWVRYVIASTFEKIFSFFVEFNPRLILAVVAHRMPRLFEESSKKLNNANVDSVNDSKSGIENSFLYE